MADGMSILTSVSKVGSVSRAVQGQQSHAEAQEQAAKRVRDDADHDSVLLAKIEEIEKTRVRERDDDTRRRRRRGGRKRRQRLRARGTRVDIKV